MKRTGKHPHNALTPAHVRSLSRAWRYADGNGLYLIVDSSSAKRWLLRTVVHGKRRDIGLGGLSITSLAAARAEAERLRRLARSGGDPLAERRVERQVMPSFESAAISVHESHRGSWRNPKHAAQWITSLETYVFPVFGDKPVDKVDSADIIKALSPIWLTKAETAKRVLQRIRSVFDWAIASGYRKGTNPVQGVPRVLPRRKVTSAHHEALPYAEVPQFIRRLLGFDATLSTRLALEFLILTAARTSEVLNATWGEIDARGGTWTISATRMKAHREHRVPLAPRCLALLKQAENLGGKPYIFPGRNPDKPLSNMAFLMLLRRMQVTCTAHGFRSSFRDWASEQTHFPNAVCEAALAHVIKDKAEAAYHRTDLYEKRRELMGEWATFSAGRK